MRPLCVQCNREMTPIKNGVLCYHLYQHPKPGTPPQEKRDGFTVINVDVLLEGSWNEGDVDFIVNGDLYECPLCKHKIVTGYGKKVIDYDVPQEQLKEEVKRAMKHKCAIEILR